MTYQQYIDLGFERINMGDTVEQKRTGYSGYTLRKEISDRIIIEVYWAELETPKMYIKKLNSDTCHTLILTSVMVNDLLGEKIDNPYFGIG